MLFAGYNQNARDHTIADTYSIGGAGSMADRLGRGPGRVEVPG
jgi:hypothetical protein